MKIHPGIDIDVIRANFYEQASKAIDKHTSNSQDNLLIDLLRESILKFDPICMLLHDEIYKETTNGTGKR